MAAGVAAAVDGVAAVGVAAGVAAGGVVAGADAAGVATSAGRFLGLAPLLISEDDQPQSAAGETGE